MRGTYEILLIIIVSECCGGGGGEEVNIHKAHNKELGDLDYIRYLPFCSTSISSIGRKVKKKCKGKKRRLTQIDY